jgi:NAD+ kinase
VQTTSIDGSPTPLREPVRRAAYVTHGKPATIGDAVGQLERIAAASGVQLVDDDPEIAVVLGGDGTMLRALQRWLGTQVPVIGVNFGRVGFLASMRPEEMEEGLRRVFAGEYVVYGLPTLDAAAGEEKATAVNDVVATSAMLGRMVELDWKIGGETMGRVPCDGVICSTPSGSTAYNLSNGGPVLMWEIDAQAITFVAPHSLSARPVVVPRTRGVEITNATPDVSLALLADGHRFAEVGPGGSVRVRLGEASTMLATLPEATFVTRYLATFASS